MDYIYAEKTKDYTVYRILSLYNKFSARDLFYAKMGVLVVPIVLMLILSQFIKENTILFIIGINFISIIFLLYSLLILIQILKVDTGNEKMMDIADAIKEGAEGFFMTQYSTIFKLSIVFGIGIFVFYLGRELSPDETLKDILGSNVISAFIVFSFFMGALCSAISGYTGMWVSVRANIRYSDTK